MQQKGAAANHPHTSTLGLASLIPFEHHLHRALAAGCHLRRSTDETSCHIPAGRLPSVPIGHGQNAYGPHVAGVAAGLGCLGCGAIGSVVAIGAAFDPHFEPSDPPLKRVGTV